MDTKFEFENFPKYTAMVALFNRVENCGELKEALRNGTLDVALIDPTLVGGSFHVHCAINKAIAAMSSGTMKTRSGHAEVLYALSGSRSIKEAFDRFGARNDSRALLAVLLSTSCSSWSDVLSLVRGDTVPLDHIGALRSKEQILEVGRDADPTWMFIAWLAVPCFQMRKFGSFMWVQNRLYGSPCFNHTNRLAVFQDLQQRNCS
uniref:Uncharacterized protein n=1 Tax=Palpitomonas bilix TaxID=652834 RepID=A0A7S3LWH8_9EUKA|mmetsp:Transcript_6137/g.15088  ORF Transcript_6137/g.15088 Transcript_6137/m.15088 type:complete len:205 (+) Transcript_6137:405-1019(+)